jgi:hypothetical protein
MRKLAGTRTHATLLYAAQRYQAIAAIRLKSSYELQSLYPDKHPSANNKPQETRDQEANANQARSTDSHPPPSQASKRADYMFIRRKEKLLASPEWRRGARRESTWRGGGARRMTKVEAGRGGA